MYLKIVQICLRSPTRLATIAKPDRLLARVGGGKLSREE